MSFEKPFLERLDAEHRVALEMIPEGLTDFSSIPSARQRVAELMRASAGRQPFPGDVVVRDLEVSAEADRPAILLRLYRPEGKAEALPAMLFIHGGGYVVGQVEHFDLQCAQLAVAASVVIASVDYRLAPEHPYPAPLEDCYAALRWLTDSAADLLIEPARIGVGGTSAGGGLAAGLALLARDRREPPVLFQWLEAPMLDHRTRTASSQSIDHSRVWNTATNRVAWQAYLGPDHLKRQIPAYASPALAEDLRDLPAAFISIGSQDIFLDEAFDYAQRLIHAGNHVQFHVYEQGFHGSARVAPTVSVSARWRRDSAEAIARLAGATTTSSTDKD